jgi:Kef-type K+ transport system membrane component KefB
MAVAVLGVVFPFILGYGVAAVAGHSGTESSFVAAALVATSVGITARVLADLGKTTKRSSRVILGAAVIDDILGLMVLAVVVGLSAGSLEPAEMVLLIVEALGFVGALLIFGPRLMDRVAHLLEWPKIPRSPFAVSVAILLGLSVAAAELQLAAIVGAFLAGTVLSTTREHYALERQFEPVADLLTPFFFIVTGAQIDVGVFGKGSVLLLAGALTVVGIAGKLAGGIIGSRGLTRRERLIIGVGMVPRGEVGIIVATIGFTRGVIDLDLFGAVLIMVIVTTLSAPPFLQRLFASEDRAAAAEQP